MAQWTFTWHESEVADHVRVDAHRVGAQEWSLNVRVMTPPLRTLPPPPLPLSAPSVGPPSLTPSPWYSKPVKRPEAIVVESDEEEDEEVLVRGPKRARSPEGPDAPPAKRARTINAALMPPAPPDVAQIRARLTKGACEKFLAEHPAFGRARLDTEEGKHDYYVDGEKVGWCSGSKLSDFFYGPFDRMGISAKVAGSTGRPQADILAEWEAQRNLGTKLHRAYEAFLRWEDPWPAGVMQPSVGFLRWLETHPRWDIRGVEVTVVDREHKLTGQFDALFWDEERQCYVLLDWKHWSGDPERIYTDDKKQPKMGVHPLTCHLTATTLQKSQLQPNVYAYMLGKEGNGYHVQVTDMRLLRIYTDDGGGAPMGAFHEYQVEPIDMPAYIAAWKAGPVALPDLTVADLPPLEGALAADAGQDGPTRVVHMTRDLLSAPPEHAVVWCGFGWKSGKRSPVAWALPQSDWALGPHVKFRMPTLKELRDYEAALLAAPALLERLRAGELRGRRLACWCDEGLCGCYVGKVLRRYANVYGSQV